MGDDAITDRPLDDDDGEPKRPTMHDVAARAGVALSTVSRALGDHPDVSAAMRRRVRRAAAELGYEPNFLAQSLRRGTTNTVGFVIRDISNPFFAAIANGAESELRQHGFVMLLVNSNGDPDLEATHIDVLRRRRVDGLIANLVSEDHPATLKAIRQLASPLVLIDRDLPGIAASALLCDHYTGVREAVEDLLDRGHERIALVTGHRHVRPVRERVRGLTDAMAARRIPVDERLVVLGSFTSEFARQHVLELLDGPDAPTAFLTGGLQVTLGCLLAFAERDLRPGLDIGLVALDEIEMLDVFRPTISVVARYPQQMGAQAAQLFLERHAGGPTRTVVLPTRYLAGSSSALPVHAVAPAAHR